HKQGKDFSHIAGAGKTLVLGHSQLILPCMSVYPKVSEARQHRLVRDAKIDPRMLAKSVVGVNHGFDALVFRMLAPSCRQTIGRPTNRLIHGPGTPTKAADDIGRNAYANGFERLFGDAGITASILPQLPPQDDAGLTFSSHFLPHQR